MWHTPYMVYMLLIIYPQADAGPKGSTGEKGESGFMGPTGSIVSHCNDLCMLLGEGDNIFILIRKHQ